MLNPDVEAWARECLSAYQSKDLTYFKEHFSQNVVLRDWNYEVTGREAAVQEFQKNFKEAKSLKHEIRNIFVSEFSVAAEIDITINLVDCLHVVDILKFNETGEIASITAYKGL